MKAAQTAPDALHRILDPPNLRVHLVALLCQHAQVRVVSSEVRLPSRVSMQLRCCAPSMWRMRLTSVSMRSLRKRVNSRSHAEVGQRTSSGASCTQESAASVMAEIVQDDEEVPCPNALGRVR